MDLFTSVTSVAGIGPKMGNRLEKLDVHTVFDLLYHIPFRYEDRTQNIIGQILNLKNNFTKSYKVIQQGQVVDSAGHPHEVIWFNQPFLLKTLTPGTKISFWGKTDFFGRNRAYINPEYEIVSPLNPLLHTGRIVSIYPETSGITSKWLRIKINSLLTGLSVNEIYPPPPGFLDWKSALIHVHQPDNFPNISRGKARMALDELILLNLVSTDRKQSWNRQKISKPLVIPAGLLPDFTSKLPFTLTAGQDQAIRQIYSDLSQIRPMNRLLEGDVGSGKTVVAAAAILACRQNGLKSILLAPTQILAQQHYQTLTSILSSWNISVGLVLSGSAASSKKINRLKSHDLLIGTHALLTDRLKTPDLGLVIIDEQHRFGVIQRGLAASLGTAPHILTMTATPIPRTIALTYYADLDLSILPEKPLGRTAIKTWVVPASKKTASYSWINNEILSNHTQVFIVCPFIEPSETMQSVKSAILEYENIKKQFPNLNVGLLHGRMSNKDKSSVMDQFAKGLISILVCTPIVEVGLDIKNAAIMVIEAADRFGLAQLHQLRGRVGRSDQPSYCLLFSSDSNSASRLKLMEKYDSGFELSEQDLKIRGAGQIYGVSQHGIPQFKIADYSNPALFEIAKAHAQKLYASLSSNPLLLAFVKTAKISLVNPN